jgi:hypothetical protein
MGKPTKQQIAEARKRGIVPGARIACLTDARDKAIVPPINQWECWSDSGMGFSCPGVEMDRIYISCGRGENIRWATVIKAPMPTQPRVKGRFAAKPKEQPATTYDLLCEVSGRIIAMEARIMERINLMHDKVITETNAIDETVDRIEGYLNKVGQAVVDQGREFKSKLSAIESSVAVIRAEATFMQQLEKDAPVGLKAGDYCDASKEVADELTAMWTGEYIPAIDQSEFPYFEYWSGPSGIRLIRTTVAGYTHLGAQTFLSRARVTAKELGLTPVEAPAEVWTRDVKGGDWAIVTPPFLGALGSTVDWPTHPVKCSHVSKDGVPAFIIGDGYRYCEKGYYRPATEAEIAAHLDAQAPQVDELQPKDYAKCDRSERIELLKMAEAAGFAAFPFKQSDHNGLSTGLWLLSDGTLWLASHPRGANEIPTEEFRRRLLGTIAKRKEAERAEKLVALKFGVRVKAARGEGMYWKKVSDEWHDITFPDGWASCSTEELTIL